MTISCELHPSLLGVAALNPDIRHDSPSRVQMWTSHQSQALVVDGATIRRSLTGMEREYGKYTFKLQFPCDAYITKVVQKYPRGIGSSGFKENPLSAIIYEDLGTGEFGVMMAGNIHMSHQYFGFRYKYNGEVLSKITQGAHIPAGTVLADTPNVTKDGDWMCGVEANVYLSSIPAGIEDGIVMSDEFVKKLATRVYGVRVKSWGKNSYPLNIYGDDRAYKPIPDIGDLVREDGLLMVLRTYDELLGAVEMSPAALREPDYIYDQRVYADPGSRVVDVKVYHDRSSKNVTPEPMDEQLLRYEASTHQFHKEIVDEYFRLKKRRGKDLRLSAELHRLIVESFSHVQDPAVKRIQKTYKGEPMDAWRVEITTETVFIPTIGSKATDNHGGKGVNVAVWRKEDMPTDSAGNVADVVMDDKSTIKRMNSGRLVEMYINAASRDFSRDIAETLSRGETSEVVDALWDKLMAYYELTSPQLYKTCLETYTGSDRVIHLRDVATNGIYLHRPTNNPVDTFDVIRSIRDNFSPVFGPITYRSPSGEVVTTKTDSMIGSMYIMLLEKIGEDWSSVASAPLQHHGIPDKLSPRNKHSKPGRASPTRITGEDETRLFAATMDGDAIADLIDQSNNPAVHKHVYYGILTAEEPGNIECLVNRDEMPAGRGRPLAYINHVLECNGVRFVREKGDDEWEQ